MTTMTPGSRHFEMYRVHTTNSSPIENSVKSTKFGDNTTQPGVPGGSKKHTKLLSDLSSFNFFSIFWWSANYIFNYSHQNKLTPWEVVIPKPSCSHFRHGILPLSQENRTHFSTLILSSLPKDRSPGTEELTLGYIYTIPPTFQPNRLLFQNKLWGHISDFSAGAWIFKPFSGVHPI